MRSRPAPVWSFVVAATLATAPVSLAQAGPRETPPVARTIDALAGLTELRVGESTRVTIPVVRGLETLDLTRFTALAPGARVVAVDARGVEQAVDLSGLVLLKGTIAGDPDSLAFLSYMDGQVNGFVRSDLGLRVISSGKPGVPNAPIFYAPASELDLSDDPFCSTGTNDPAFYPDRVVPAPASETPGPRGDGPCRVARVAVDTDYEFTALFGGNTTLSAAYAVTLLSASSSIYERDVNVRFLLPFVRVWASNNDPYVGNAGTTDFLFEMQDHWNLAMSHSPRETVHGLSGRGLGGGVAYLNATCYLEYAYGVSANINGYFPLPVIDNSDDNWDLMVVSHELGHNFGSGHTHDGYTPPIDGCGTGDCSLALDSSIMSYCHQCPGGISNMDMRFGPRVEDRILEYLNSAACDLTAGPAPIALDDAFQVIQDASIELDVLSNDAAQSCAPAGVAVTSFQSPTSAGGAVAAVPGSAYMLRYTPPAGFIGFDSFNYTTAFGSASVSVDVLGLRQALDAPPTDPGVDTDYFVLSNPQSMPDFDSMTPYASDVLSQINIASTGGDFATSGRSDNVGAVFTSLLEVPQNGWYRLSIESDDGSRLWLGDDLVVDNDGLHGMVDAGANIPLEAGKHRVRAEFFESGGGAGVIVRYAGPTVARQPVPASAWSRDFVGQCAADLAPPYGTLNFFDISEFLRLYSIQDPGADLAAPFGVWNFFDTSAYLGLYNAGCP